MNEQELEMLAEREAALARDEADREATAKAAQKKGWPVNTSDGVVMVTRNLLIGNQRVVVTAAGDRYAWSHEHQAWRPLEPGPPPKVAPEGQDPLPEPDPGPVDASGGSNARPKRAAKKTTTKED